MSEPLSPEACQELLRCFRCPSVQTMMSRKSSITNAFVNSVIPVIEPKAEEIAESLRILQLSASDLRCAYCGDVASEWDHLRPLVIKHRPTGFITEINNLVPSCGKCNQSKGNKPWREWMTSKAPRSPKARGIPDIEARVERLATYEAWRPPTHVDFQHVLGADEWKEYWVTWERLIVSMRVAQDVADKLRAVVAQHMQSRPPRVVILAPAAMVGRLQALPPLVPCDA